MQGENGTAEVICKGIILTLLTVVFIPLMMTVKVFACDYHSCDELPPNITDCPICLYENWDDDLKEYVSEICDAEGMYEPHVLAIIWNESRFDSNARSSYYSTANYGLMQVNSVTYDYLNEEIGLTSLDELFDPEINIQAGIALLKYHEYYTDTDRQMILRYQVGEGNYANMIANGEYSIGPLESVMSKSAIYEDYLYN